MGKKEIIRGEGGLTRVGIMIEIEYKPSRDLVQSKSFVVEFIDRLRSTLSKAGIHSSIIDCDSIFQVISFSGTVGNFPLYFFFSYAVHF